MEKTQTGAKEQEDVLPAKDNVLDGPRGLQVYDDAAMPDGAPAGTAGTAERAAKITRAQLEKNE